MTTIAVSKIEITSNVRIIPGVEDISKATFDDLPEGEQQEIKELAESIASQGLLQSIVVRGLKGGRFRLIAGWRRLMAHKYLNRASIDAKIKNIKKEDESVVQLIENIHRKDLNPMAIAVHLDKLRTEKNIKNQDALAKFVNKSTGWVSYHLKFLKAVPEVQDAIRSGEIGASGARVLVSMPKDEQANALNAARDEAQASGEVDKSGKPKVKTKGVRRQSRRSKEAKRRSQVTIKPVAEREQEQKEEMVLRFFENEYGQKKVSPAFKRVVNKFWDFLMEQRRLVIK